MLTHHDLVQVYLDLLAKAERQNAVDALHDVIIRFLSGPWLASVDDIQQLRHYVWAAARNADVDRHRKHVRRRKHEKLYFLQNQAIREANDS